jgi:uncharacterized membrane protein
MNPVTVTLLHGLTGLLFVGLSIPLICGRIPPNRFYGFRTPKTLSDPKIWYEANRIMGNDLFLAGAVLTLSSIAMLLIARDWTVEHVTLTLLLILIFSMVGVAWHGFSVLRRM